MQADALATLEQFKPTQTLAGDPEGSEPIWRGRQHDQIRRPRVPTPMFNVPDGHLSKRARVDSKVDYGVRLVGTIIQTSRVPMPVAVAIACLCQDRTHLSNSMSMVSKVGKKATKKDKHRKTYYCNCRRRSCTRKAERTTCYNLPGTKNQPKVMRTRMPVPMPNVPAAPILASSALLMNPPRKREPAPISR